MQELCTGRTALSCGYVTRDSSTVKSLFTLTHCVDESASSAFLSLIDSGISVTF